MALTTLSAAKTQLKIADAITDYDARVNALIAVASQRISSYCNRVFEPATYTETFDGRRQNEVLLSQFPITSITSVHIDSSRVFGATSLLPVDDYDADTDTGMVRFHNGNLPSGSKNIQIVYDAGYAVIPADLDYACVMFVEFLYNQNDDRRIGIKSKGKDQESVTYILGMPQEVVEIIDHYRIMDPWTSRGVRNV